MQSRVPKLAAAFVLCLLGAVCRAAEPSAQPAAEPARPRWQSEAAVGFTLTSGNKDTMLLTAKLGTERKGVKNEWLFGLDGAYGESSGDVNNQTLRGSGQFNHLWSERLFVYLKVDGLHDGIAGLKYRFTVSPGAGYYFIKNKSTSLSAEVGAGYVQERLNGTDQGYFTLRLANRFEHKLDERSRLWQKAEYLPRPDNFSEYLVNAEIGVETKLVGNLALKVYLQDFYNSRPAAGRKPNDLKLVSAIAYKF